jgi:hypothetical protein
MTYNPNPTRTWDRNTPADGDLIQAEIQRVYENSNDLNGREIALRAIQKGLTRGRMEVYNDSPTILRLRRNNVYEVNQNFINLNGELTIDFSSLTNIFRNDGTTPITATSETQNKHLYVLLTEVGNPHAMIIPDSEMSGSSHVYLSNPKLLADFYTGSPVIFDPAKNGYYKSSKRVIGTIRLNASNQIEFFYELGFGHRFMDVQNLPIGGTYTETRWKREHPNCYVPDGSTVSAMSTESPVLHRILGGNVLPDWRNRFPRSVDIAGARNMRDTQEDAFQGHRFARQSDSTPLRTDNFVSGGGSSGVRTDTGTPMIISSDGTNGTPRIANETRSANFAVSMQIVRG